ncbi:hypothetical protein V8E54_008975 [Elaphomyces granulatus]
MGFVDFDGSEDLGRYFIRSQLGKTDKCQVLLSVYDAAPLAAEFAEVDWDGFRLIDKEHCQGKKVQGFCQGRLGAIFQGCCASSYHKKTCEPSSRDAIIVDSFELYYNVRIIN